MDSLPLCEAFLRFLDKDALNAYNDFIEVKMVAHTKTPEPPSIPQDWLAEFEAAAQRSLATRFRYAFIKTYKPVMDDAPYRSFDTTAEYREWCKENLPDWLGYGRV